MIIITGTGRSGTKTFAGMLGGFHEFRVNYILDKYFSKAEPHTDPFDSIEKRLMVVLDLFQGIDGKDFMDSSNLHIHFIDAISILYPSAKFILSVRHGKDFVRSALSRGWHKQNSFGTVPLRSDPYFTKWDAMTPLQKNAWIWVYRNRRALEGLRSVPEGRKMVVRLEDIGKPETVERIELFTGKSIERSAAGKRLNANPVFGLPPKEDWTADMDRDFEEIAGEMMRLFGYY